jgi:hypothetical protein
LQRLPGTPLIAAAFAAVLVNIGHGRNGFLTAAMRDGALHLHRGRSALTLSQA